jgi:release factor glutamine methyltransferase
MAINTVSNQTALSYLRQGIEMLEAKGISEARISAEELLSYVLRRPKFLIYAEPDLEISTIDAAQYCALLEKRAARYPLQYLLKNVAFRSVTLWIGKGCLIPRPETEFLVEVVLKELENRSSGLEILDIGTGSGNIAVSIARERVDWRVTASDISEEALQFASVNVRENQVAERVRLIQADLWKANETRRFDAVISNPPYLTRSEMETLQSEITFEPSLALDGGEDGLDFFRRIVENSEKVLKPGGMIFFEVGAGQAGKVSRLLNENGFESVKMIDDLAGIQRVVLGKLKTNG